MAALWDRAGHYILPCDFYLSFFLSLFPHLREVVQKDCQACILFIFILFRNSQFHMQYKRNIEDKRVQYEI